MARVPSAFSAGSLLVGGGPFPTLNPLAGVAAKVCARCGAGFGCGAQSAEGCWCATLPPVLRQEGVADCLCPACLERAIPRAAGS